MADADRIEKLEALALAVRGWHDDPYFGTEQAMLAALREVEAMPKTSGE